MAAHKRARDTRLPRDRTIRANAAHERRNGQKRNGRENDQGAAPKIVIVAGEGGEEQTHTHEKPDDGHMIEQQVQVVEVHARSQCARGAKVCYALALAESALSPIGPIVPVIVPVIA
jgi:hypothetical protein